MSVPFGSQPESEDGPTRLSGDFVARVQHSGPCDPLRSQAPVSPATITILRGGDEAGLEGGADSPAVEPVTGEEEAALVGNVECHLAPLEESQTVSAQGPPDPALSGPFEGATAEEYGGADEAEEQLEEAIRVKPARDPGCPTAQERAEHEATPPTLSGVVPCLCGGAASQPCPCLSGSRVPGCAHYPDGLWVRLTGRG